MTVKKIDKHSDQQELNSSSCDNALERQRELLSRKIEDRYRSFFENIEQAYFEIDKDGNFSFFNDHLCEMLGYKTDELIGENLLHFLDNEDSDRVETALREIFETDKSKNGLIFKIVRKDGLKRYIGSSM